MKLKTSPVKAIERGIPVKDSSDIELLGTETLCCDENYAMYIKAGIISSQNNSFVSVFGLGNKFFYSVKLNCELDGFTEIGVGYIEQHDGKFYLKRFNPQYIHENGVSVRTSRPRPIVCEDHHHVLVSSIIPSKYVDVLTDEHSVIVSNHPHVPSSVSLSENSILGRKTDSIESISFDEISKSTLDFIKLHTKSLILKSSNLKVKKISTESINLTPTSSKPLTRGTIIYDEAQDLLKYYDGKNWRILMYQVDE